MRIRADRRRPISHLVAGDPVVRPDVAAGGCEECGGDCVRVRAGTPGHGAWFLLACLRCPWRERPRDPESVGE